MVYPCRGNDEYADAVVVQQPQLQLQQQESPGKTVSDSALRPFHPDAAELSGER